MRVFDSHAHLNDERYDEDREAVIERTLAELAGMLHPGPALFSLCRYEPTSVA